MDVWMDGWMDEWMDGWIGLLYYKLPAVNVLTTLLLTDVLID